MAIPSVFLSLGVPWDIKPKPTFKDYYEQISAEDSSCQFKLKENE